MLDEWVGMMGRSHTDHALVAAYWMALAHRVECEVCRDEDAARALGVPPQRPLERNLSSSSSAIH